MSAPVIRPVDVHRHEDIDAFLSVYAAAEQDADPQARLNTRQDALAMLGTHDAYFLEGHVAYEPGDPGGRDRMLGASLTSGSRRDNLTLGYLQVWVHPDHRREGIGTAVADAAERRLRRDGRTVILAEVRAGPGQEGNQRFAEARGYRASLSQVERRLAIPVDGSRLDALAAIAAERHEGYDVRARVGDFPPELRASYVALRNLLAAEAPSGLHELEEAAETVADFVATEERNRVAERVPVTGYAVRGEEVVAYAEASVPLTGTAYVDQWGTLVHPDHRGHRLGMAVKCAQLRAVSEAYPDHAYIGTTNAEVNEHMVAINVALGFEVHQVWVELEKRLGGPLRKSVEQWGHERRS